MRTMKDSKKFSKETRNEGTEKKRREEKKIRKDNKEENEMKGGKKCKERRLEVIRRQKSLPIRSLNFASRSKKY
jgi:hypothetical protein